MRASDSSVGGAAGQFHTTRWAVEMVSANGPSQSVSLAVCDGLVGGLKPSKRNLKDLWRNPVGSWDQRNRKHAPARSAARSSSPRAIESSVQFVSCAELLAGNLQQAGNRIQ
jgi:hypothetical protein